MITALGLFGGYPALDNLPELFCFQKARGLNKGKLPSQHKI